MLVYGSKAFPTETTHLLQPSANFKDHNFHSHPQVTPFLKTIYKKLYDFKVFRVVFFSGAKKGQMWGTFKHSLKLRASLPLKKQWLEDEMLFLGWPIFSGYASFWEGIYATNTCLNVYIYMQSFSTRLDHHKTSKTTFRLLF